jgi:hypothetical protein
LSHWSILSIFMPWPCRLSYCRLDIYFEVRCYVPPGSFFLLKIVSAT